MGGNGEKKEEKKIEGGLEEKFPKVIIQVLMYKDGSCEMKSSLPPPMIIYAFEELKINLINKANEKPTLFKPSGGFYNRIREKFIK